MKKVMTFLMAVALFASAQLFAGEKTHRIDIIGNNQCSATVKCETSKADILKKGARLYIRAEKEGTTSFEFEVSCNGKLCIELNTPKAHCGIYDSVKINGKEMLKEPFIAINRKTKKKIDWEITDDKPIKVEMTVRVGEYTEEKAEENKTEKDK